MRHIKFIPIRRLIPFVEQQLGLQPPVFWELALASEDVTRFQAIAPARRRSDSNTLEIALDVGIAVDRDDPKFVREFQGMVRRFAEAEDERNLHTTEGPLPAGVNFELESRVPVAEGDRESTLEVIGPGGRATVFRRVRGLSADVTIRRRSRAERGVWRRVHEILRPLSQALGEVIEEPTVRAAFGYFELSKYEAQSLMRPVFLFVIEQEQDPDGRWPGFQRIVVSSATTSGDLGTSEGLGMWAESLRCSG